MAVKNDPLTLYERQQIEFYMKSGYSCSRTAKVLGRHPKTVSRELTLGGGRNNYNAQLAQKSAREREAKRPQPTILSQEQDAIIRQCVSEGRSKEHIRLLAGIGTGALHRFMDEHHPGYKALYGAGLPSIERRVSALEEQIKILTDVIKEIRK